MTANIENKHEITFMPKKFPGNHATGASENHSDEMVLNCDLRLMVQRLCAALGASAETKGRGLFKYRYFCQFLEQNCRGDRNEMARILMIDLLPIK